MCICMSIYIYIYTAKLINNRTLPGVPRQFEDGLVQTEGCWSPNRRLSGMVRSSRGGAWLKVRQPEDRLAQRDRQLCNNADESCSRHPIEMLLYPSCRVHVQPERGRNAWWVGQKSGRGQVGTLSSHWLVPVQDLDVHWFLVCWRRWPTALHKTCSLLSSDWPSQKVGVVMGVDSASVPANHLQGLQRVGVSHGVHHPPEPRPLLLLRYVRTCPSPAADWLAPPTAAGSAHRQLHHPEPGGSPQSLPQGIMGDVFPLQKGRGWLGGASLSSAGCDC